MAGFAKVLELRLQMVAPVEEEGPPKTKEQARLESVAKGAGPAGFGAGSGGVDRSGFTEGEPMPEPMLPTGLLDTIEREGIPVGEDELLSLQMAAKKSDMGQGELPGFVVAPMGGPYAGDIAVEEPRALTPDQLEFLGVEGEEEVLLSAMRPPRERMM